MAYDETTHDKINGFPVAIIDDTETTTGVHTWTGKKINAKYNELDDKISSIGVGVSASTASSNPVTCASSTYTECVNITLDAGVYLFSGMLAFAANSNGVRGVNISTNSGDQGVASTRLTVNACSEGQTRFQTVTVITVQNDSTTFYLNAYQNSGSNLDVVYSRLFAVKIAA